MSRVELFDPFGGSKKSVADWDSEGRVVVVVLDVSLRWMDEGRFVVFDLVFHTPDAILKAILFLGIGLVASFKSSGQSFGNVGDQDNSDVVGAFDDLECSAWRERRGLEGGV